ncbi:MAG: ankyrin repeat domain-containing protein [Kiritimatiellae bacterium]|nr:ankyrin repeat domain-containing protein [Kiritimatiellia bacterium]
MAAALNGHAEIVRYLLDQGLDVNKRSDDGTTVLLNALGLNLHKKYGICNLETVNLLLDRGADRHAVDNDGVTALMKAASRQPELAMALIDSKSDLRAEDNRGWPLIEYAAGGGNLELVRFLLARGVSPNEKKRNGECARPLVDAVCNGHAAIARLLLEKGADVNARSKDGYCALLAAVGKGYVTLAELLLSRGAHVNVCDKDGNSPLHKAVDGEETGVVELLLSRNADIRIKNAKGDTAWTIAIRKDFHPPDEILAALAPKGEVSDAVLNQTLFLCAAKKGRMATIERKAAEGININARDENGSTALHYAASENHTNVVSFLLSRGADVDSKNNDRMTPLMLASRRTRLESVELLLSKGADVHAKDNQGMTALARWAEGLNSTAYSYRSRISRLFDLLLARGAKIEATDIHGRTALLLAVQKSNALGVELLLAQGAKVNKMDSHGVTPFKLAAEKNDVKIMELLLSKSADIPTASIVWARDVAKRFKRKEAMVLLARDFVKKPGFSGTQKSN